MYAQKKYTKVLGLMLLSMILFSFTSAVLEKDKQVVENFMVDPASRLSLINTSGPINITRVDGVEATIEARIIVQGKDEVEIQKVLDQFKVEISSMGGKIDVAAEDHVKNWIKVNTMFRNINKIEFDDGGTAFGIESIEIFMDVKLPKIAKLILKTRCDDITYDQLDCDVEAELFTGGLSGGDIDGNLDLSLKYGKAEIGNFLNGDIELFDAEFFTENASSVKMNSKYSEVKMKDIKKLTFESFDDNAEIGHTETMLEVDARYSDINFKTFDESKMLLFECDMVGEEGENIFVETKYSDFRIGDVAEMEVVSFDDEFRIGAVHKFTTKDCKYTTLKMDEIKIAGFFLGLFENDVHVSKLSEKVRSINVEGKYGSFSTPIPSSMGYQIDADMRYGDLIYDGTAEINQESSFSDYYKIVAPVNNGGDLYVSVSTISMDITLK